MKKLFYTFVMSFAFLAYPQDDTGLNLRNGDVLHCLVDAAKSEGWLLISIYDNTENKRVVMFKKGKDFKKYVSRK